MRQPPPIASLQPMTPPLLDQIVRGCLAKESADRWQTAHDVTKQLQWIGGESTVAAAAPADRTARGGRMWMAATVLLAFATASLSWAYISHSQNASEGALMRFTVTKPDKVKLASVVTSLGVSASMNTISPDGSRLVFAGIDEMTGRGLLYLRPIDSVDATPVQGTEGATCSSRALTPRRWPSMRIRILLPVAKGLPPSPRPKTARSPIAAHQAWSPIDLFGLAAMERKSVR